MTKILGAVWVVAALATAGCATDASIQIRRASKASRRAARTPRGPFLRGRSELVSSTWCAWRAMSFRVSASSPRARYQGSLSPYDECTGVSQGDTSILVFTDHASAIAYANDMISVGQQAGSPAAQVVRPELGGKHRPRPRKQEHQGSRRPAQHPVCRCRDHLERRNRPREPNPGPATQVHFVVTDGETPQSPTARTPTTGHQREATALSATEWHYRSMSLCPSMAAHSTTM